MVRGGGERRAREQNERNRMSLPFLPPQPLHADSIPLPYEVSSSFLLSSCLSFVKSRLCRFHRGVVCVDSLKSHLCRSVKESPHDNSLLHNLLRNCLTLCLTYLKVYGGAAV